MHCGREVAAQGHELGLAGPFPRPGDTSSLAPSDPLIGALVLECRCSFSAGRRWLWATGVPPTGDGDLRHAFPSAGPPPWRPGVPKTLWPPRCLAWEEENASSCLPSGNAQERNSFSPRSPQLLRGPRGRGAALQQDCGQSRAASLAIHSRRSPLLRAVCVVSSKCHHVLQTEPSLTRSRCQRSQRLRAPLPSTAWWRALRRGFMARHFPPPVAPLWAGTAPSRSPELRGELLRDPAPGGGGLPGPARITAPRASLHLFWIFLLGPPRGSKPRTYSSGSCFCFLKTKFLFLREDEQYFAVTEPWGQEVGSIAGTAGQWGVGGLARRGRSLLGLTLLCSSRRRATTWRRASRAKVRPGQPLGSLPPGRAHRAPPPGSLQSGALSGAWPRPGLWDRSFLPLHPDLVLMGTVTQPSQPAWCPPHVLNPQRQHRARGPGAPWPHSWGQRHGSCGEVPSTSLPLSLSPLPFHLASWTSPWAQQPFPVLIPPSQTPAQTSAGLDPCPWGAHHPSSLPCLQGWSGEWKSGSWVGRI